MISFSTIIGIASGVALFVFAIMSSTDNYLMFLSLSSLAMVLGGTLAASLISFSTIEVLHALRAFLETFMAHNYEQRHLKKLIERFKELSDLYRGNGITAIENALTKQEKKDHMIVLGVELMGNGYKPMDLRMMLTDAMDSHWQRLTLEAKVLNTMGVYAPGFGMVGTIIGLIIMLDNMSGDMAALGKGLALALLTTLYGVLLAQLIFKPTANQVTETQEKSYFRDQIITEGFVMLAEKKDGIYIQDRLNSYVNPKSRVAPVETD